MKDRSHSVALQIAQIIEENSSQDVSKAVAILRKCGSISELLGYLIAVPESSTSTRVKKSSGPATRTKPIDQIVSKAVRELEKSDPDKFVVLSRFDRLVRQGKALESNDSLRRFGENISKDFRHRSARKDNISALMTVLAHMPKEELVAAIEKAVENSARSNFSEFQNLASFLMQGKRK